MDIQDVEQFIEEKLRFKSGKNKTVGAETILSTKGSAGNNSEKLARILAAWDFACYVMGWEDKPLGHLSAFFSQYQGSLNAKYHNDFKDVLIAEEIERRKTERKGISIMQSGG